MLAQLIGAGIGGLTNAWNAYEQSKKQKEMLRLEEDYNRSANAKLERANEANQLINPQAAAQRARQDVNATQSAAVGQALNAAAGAGAQSGDFGNAQAQGIQMSQAAQAAAAPYAQQNAQITQQALQGEQQKVQQAESIANSQAKLSDYVTYLEREKNNINPLASALQVGFGSLVGGANVASNLLGLANDTDKTTQLDENSTAIPMMGAQKTPQPTVQQQVTQQESKPFLDLTQTNPGVNLFSNEINKPMNFLQPQSQPQPQAPQYGPPSMSAAQMMLARANPLKYMRRT